MEVPKVLLFDWDSGLWDDTAPVKKGISLNCDLSPPSQSVDAALH